MVFDIEMIRQRYATMPEAVAAVRQATGSALTLAEKILLTHLYDQDTAPRFRRGEDYVNFAPDRVAMQDATAQMALLQFMNAGRQRVAVPSTVHCDHLIQADRGAAEDLPAARETNREVYDFLSSVSNKYGIGFWKPGAGIIHQVVLENYAFPGGMMIGTDSHTPNAGGLGMIAVGVGGADAADVMSGMPWELKMPRLIGVKLTGKLSGWAAPKDVILKLAGILTVKGGTNAIIEYFGPGTATLSATGKATICNMGAEVGATTSLFPYDAKIAAYLRATGRSEVADLADGIAAECLTADAAVLEHPERYYDRVIEIDLSTLEPYINGPFTPDAAAPISEFVRTAREKGYPERMEVGLIGSCTNSSYEDLMRAASVARQAAEKGLNVQAEYIITPGSEQVRYTAERDGVLKALEAIGGVVMSNACGACIGQWKRHTDDPKRANSIVTSFNRNFAARNDGNPATHAFVASPELTTALTIAGRITFNPLTDTLTNGKGEAVKLDPPTGDELPVQGYAVEDAGYQAPAEDGSTVTVAIAPDSQRLQRLEPFAPWNGEDYEGLRLLIKAQGKCTTDHISAAGPWLRFRGHLENISDNLLMGATNAFLSADQAVNNVLNPLTGTYDKVSSVAKAYKAAGLGSIVVAQENYGEGSSREHAAMEPRFLNVKVVLAQSFARIHETNLKKQGMLALTFAHKEDWNRVREDDQISIRGLKSFAPGSPLTVVLHHADGSEESFEANHTYNALQIEWFKAGSALNLISKNTK
ncbi:MAG TPA: aconitate hydratase [Candidatus Rikenella faecigallinarum]|uniref:Aconitate hydratase A n=1 Tax=Candidatus Rikenella faecigallinarum TaxID=2838745 RepID=A0A9D1QDU6_9BACT|nr:aconitate hydratase [Candidatus Rikenella faecigallinarum]